MKDQQDMTRQEAADILSETLDDAAHWVGHTPVDYDERNRAALAVLSAPIAAAHPKCGTCGFHGLNSMLKIKPYNACMNPRSPYFVVADGIVDPALDYCRFHPELNQPTETTP